MNCRPGAPDATRHSARRTEAQAHDVKRRLVAGERGVDLAREFGVTRSAISRIKKGKSWKNA